MSHQEAGNGQGREAGGKGRQEYIVPPLSDIPQIEPRNIEERFVHVLERNMKGNKSNTRYMCKRCQKVFAGGAQRIRVHITGIKEGNQQIEACKNPDPEAIAAFQAKPPMKPRVPKKRKRCEDSADARQRAAEAAVTKLRQDALQSAISSPVFDMLSEAQQMELKDAWFQLAIGQITGESSSDTPIPDVHPSGTSTGTTPIMIPSQQILGGDSVDI